MQFSDVIDTKKTYIECPFHHDGKIILLPRITALRNHNSIANFTLLTSLLGN